MRARLVAVYLLLHAALLLVALHFVLPMARSAPTTSCVDATDVETGETEPLCGPWEGGTAQRQPLPPLVDVLLIAACATLLLLAPMSVLEAAEWWKYQPWRPMLGTIAGLLLIAVPFLISFATWTNADVDWASETGIRISVLSFAAGMMVVHAAQKWRTQPLPSTPPPTSPAPDAPQATSTQP